MRSALVSVVVLFAAGALAGCGGDSGGSTSTSSGPSPEEQVRAAATKLVRSDDATMICDTLITRRLIDEAYGGREACLDAAVSDERQGRTEVRDVRVTGDRAQVQMVIADGHAAGFSGHVGFVRDRAAWKLDRLEDDYIRSTVDAAIRVVDEGAPALPQMKACLSKQMAAMSAGERREYLYKIMSKDRQAREQTLDMAAKCPDAVAIYVADEFADSFAQDGKPKAYVRCMRRTIRGLLSVTRLGPEVLKGRITGASKAALTGVVMGADKQCRNT